MSSYPIVLKDEFSTVIFLHQRILYGVRSVLAYPIKTIMILNTGTRLYNTNHFALLAHLLKEQEAVAGIKVLSL
jgi:hypothetical protein